MQIRVQISNPEPRPFKGVSKTSGKPFSMTFQEAWFFLYSRDGSLDPYPTKTEIILPDGKGDSPSLPYQVGEYLLHPSSFYIDRKGDFAVAPRLFVPQRPKSA